MKRLLSILGAALLLCVLPALAMPEGVVESEDPNVPGARNKVFAAGLIEDPTPMLPRATVMPRYFVIIDMRKPAFSFNPSFMNREMPTPIVPKGWGVKIIMQEPFGIDGECSEAQKKKCVTACKNATKLSVGCDLQIDWPVDGSPPIETVMCTCADPNSPRIAGNPVDATTITIKD